MRRIKKVNGNGYWIIQQRLRFNRIWFEWRVKQTRRRENKENSLNV